ncbi:NAD(P)H-quinone oxidoreductase [Alteromonas flava]|uniref:NAD(P)H-quinone oxidoreductase n=1 Tax=Alteromonas flava TaxID=2048003 RepID=UPI000C28F039|nr:NAD(P)H-quinone oxidoreductase [Alteromonas flava]
MSMTMRYVAYDRAQPERALCVENIEKPTPGDEQLLIKVAAFGVNRADLLQRQGKYPPPAGESHILGLEVSGEIVAAGKAANDWVIGDRVCGIVAGGGYAEYAVLDSKQAIPIPMGMDIRIAAGLPEVFLTAYQALFTLAKLKSNERVLIHAGASGVGLAAIQLARRNGCEVAVTASNDEKLEQCMHAGAKHLINYNYHDFAIRLKQLGWRPDVIVDVVAGDYVQRNVDILALDGRMVYLAMLGGRNANLDMAKVLAKRITLVGSTLRNRSADYKRALVTAFCADCHLAFDNGQLSVPVDSILPVAEVNVAHNKLSQNQSKGKFILYWD